jgi:hypothetical protein
MLLPQKVIFTGLSHGCMAHFQMRRQRYTISVFRQQKLRGFSRYNTSNRHGQKNILDILFGDGNYVRSLIELKTSICEGLSLAHVETRFSEVSVLNFKINIFGIFTMLHMSMDMMYCM